LLAALVLTLTPTSAAVPLAAHAATAGFFTDPAGDSGVAADITAVSVGNDTLAGDIVIWIHMANREVLPDISDLFAVFFDTDLNAATGAPGSAGSEYTAQVFREIPGSILPAVFRWTGSAWLEVPAPTLNYGFGVDEKSLRVSIHPNEIGGTRTFNFHLVSALQGQSATDVAPDFGGWPYSLISGPLQLSVERFAVRPKVPRAGKSFTASLLVGRGGVCRLLAQGWKESRFGKGQELRQLRGHLRLDDPEENETSAATDEDLPQVRRCKHLAHVRRQDPLETLHESPEVETLENACFATGSRIRSHAMRLYALTELHDPEAIELFITEEDARRRSRIVCGTSPSGAASSR
jgi:hypothetical protein